MRKKILTALSLMIAAITVYGGIFRHDVPEKEYRALAQQKQFDCVGEVFLDTLAKGACVLIDSTHVLTVAHLFMENDRRADTLQANGRQVIMYTPVNVRPVAFKRIGVVIKGNRYQITRLNIHPDYLDTVKKDDCDLAILTLERAVPEVAPATINKQFDELKSNVVGVGFGVSGPANQPRMVKPKSLKIAGENVIDSIGGEQHSGQYTVLSCDFDHPTDKTCNQMGSARPRPLEYSAGTGDDGSGLFRLKKGKWELVGLFKGSTSHIQQLIRTGYYGQIMNYTRVSAFQRWIGQNTR